MNFSKYTIRTTREGTEAVCAALMGEGINGVEIDDPYQRAEFLATPSPSWDYAEEGLNDMSDTDVKVIFYLSENPWGKDLLINVKNALERLKKMDLGINVGKLSLESCEGLNDEVWLSKWKEFYKPFNVGEKLCIRPDWEDVPDTDRIILTINPGNVFGTGLHQTTKLCLKQLEKNVTYGMEAIDLGCGSGILSAAAILLGAKHVFAADIDENAVTTAYENAGLNGIGRDRLYVTSGDILTDVSLREQIGENKYDIAAANIVADIIIPISPFVYKLLKSGGIFISSGIIKERLDEVKSAITASGFEIAETDILEDWCCITAIKG